MTANEKYHKFSLLFSGSASDGVVFNPREVQEFLNSASREVFMDKITPWRNRPQLSANDHKLRDQELAGLISSTAFIGREHFLLGTDDNGALMNADLDNVVVLDRFGVFVPTPDDMILPLLEKVSTLKGDIERNNVSVKEVNYSEYARDILNPYSGPDENLCWSMNWGAYTPGILSDGIFEKATKNRTTTGAGINMIGLNHLNNPVRINTAKARYLLADKGTKIINYKLHYIKSPADIKIDLLKPSLQINSELPVELHDIIVDKAVELAITASLPPQTKLNPITSKNNLNE